MKTQTLTYADNMHTSAAGIFLKKWIPLSALCFFEKMGSILSKKWNPLGALHFFEKMGSIFSKKWNPLSTLVSSLPVRAC